MQVIKVDRFPSFPHIVTCNQDHHKMGLDDAVKDVAQEHGSFIYTLRPTLHWSSLAFSSRFLKGGYESQKLEGSALSERVSKSGLPDVGFPMSSI